MLISPTIFRTYDIRGTYGDLLTLEGAQHIGRALGTFLIRKFKDKHEHNLVVGRDNRESSPALAQEFIKGVVSTGCNVVDVGISLTPVIHYLTCVKDFDAGVEVTASHNPKEYNGFRIDYKHATPFYGADILTLLALIVANDYELGNGKVGELDLFGEYLGYLKNRFSFNQSKKVVLDCGFGTASYFAQRVFAELGSNVLGVYCSADSNFPHGVPDPADGRLMQEIGQKVVELGGDVGFAFDTDSDRFGVVDEKGIFYSNDKLLLLFAQQLLTQKPGGVVAYDVKSSGIVDELVKTWGGVPKMVRTGHPFMVQEMKNGALVGAEFSGHMYFAENFGFDDGLYSACMTLELLEKTGKKLSELVADFPKRVQTSEIKVPCADEKKFEVIENVKTKLHLKREHFLTISELDGVRASVTATGWFLIRASNTSPYLSVCLEGQDQAEIELLWAGVKDLLGGFVSTENVQAPI